MMNSNVSQMAPEEAFAYGIGKGLQMMRNMGRNGDTELAHVNPEEAAMLKAGGGAGTRNPATGMREYFGGEGGGGSIGRDDNRGDRGPQDDRDREALGGLAGAVPGAGSARDFSRESQRGEDARRAASIVPGAGAGVATRPTSAGGTVSDMEPNRGQTGAGDDRSFGDRVMDGLSAAFAGPSLSAPAGRDPGFLGAAAGMAPGVGPLMGLVRGLQAMGYQGIPEYEDRIGDPNREQRDDGILSPPPQVPGQPAAAQQTPQFAWTRPSSMPEAPMGLGFDAGMTPLQQRTAVATGGTQADAGIYRDPAIVDFYRNLALFDLTQPGGAPRGGVNVTPIERQYVTQMGAQPGDSVQDFLTALAGL